MDWPFPSAPNTAALASADILDRGMPILWAFRDLGDGGFQFHSVNGAPGDMAEARVVGLGEMLALDPTLAAIADLRRGWRAYRPSVSDPWGRAGPEAPKPSKRRSSW